MTTKLLTLAQTADILAVSRQTVMRMISEGVLPAICLRSGKRKKIYRIRAEVLDRWLIDQEKQTARDYTGGRNGTQVEKQDESKQAV